VRFEHQKAFNMAFKKVGLSIYLESG